MIRNLVFLRIIIVKTPKAISSLTKPSPNNILFSPNSPPSLKALFMLPHMGTQNNSFTRERAKKDWTKN